MGELCELHLLFPSRLGPSGQPSCQGLGWQGRGEGWEKLRFDLSLSRGPNPQATMAKAISMCSEVGGPGLSSVW